MVGFHEAIRQLARICRSPAIHGAKAVDLSDTHGNSLLLSFFPPSLLFPVIPLLHKDLSTLSRLSVVSHPAQTRDTSDSPQVCPKSPRIQPRHHQVYA